MTDIIADIVRYFLPSRRDLANSCLPILQRQNFTYVDPVVTAYISGLVEDEDEQVEDILEQTKGMLEDATVDEKDLNAL